MRRNHDRAVEKSTCCCCQPSICLADVVVEWDWERHWSYPTMTEQPNPITQLTLVSSPRWSSLGTILCNRYCDSEYLNLLGVVNSRSSSSAAGSWRNGRMYRKLSAGGRCTGMWALQTQRPPMPKSKRASARIATTTLLICSWKPSVPQMNEMTTASTSEQADERTSE